MATDVTPDNRVDGLKTVGTSLSWNHTVSAGLVNSFIGIGGSTGASVAKPWSTVTYDAGGTNKFGNIAESNGNCFGEIWGLVAPTPGTKQIVVTPTASCEIIGGSASYQFVNQSTPWNPAGPQTNTGSVGSGGTNQPNVTVTSALHEMIFSVLLENNIITNLGTLTPGAGQTQIWFESIGATSHSSLGSDKAASAGSTAISCTGAGDFNTWASIGGSLQFDGGAPAATIRGKTLKGQYLEGEDLSFVSSSKLTKPQPGGAAPQGAGKLGKVFQSQFNDILGYDFVSSSKQTKGQPGGAAPPGASILGKSFVNNPAPNPEAEWDYANGVSVGSASPGGAAPSTTAVAVPKTISNILFVDSVDFTEYQSRIVKGQLGTPPVIGLPRHSIMSMSTIASQIIDDETMFISRFGVKNSHPAGGTIPAPPVTNVISNIGLVGVGTMRGV